MGGPCPRCDKMTKATQRRPIPISEKPSLATIWVELCQLQERISCLEDAISNGLAHRLDKIEAKLDQYAGGLSVIRWAGPLLVAIASILIARIL